MDSSAKEKTARQRQCPPAGCLSDKINLTFHILQRSHLLSYCALPKLLDERYLWNRFLPFFAWHCNEQSVLTFNDLDVMHDKLIVESNRDNGFQLAVGSDFSDPYIGNIHFVIHLPYTHTYIIFMTRLLYSKKLWFAINFSKYVGIWGNIDHLGRFIHIAKINDRSVFTDSFFDRLFA